MSKYNIGVTVTSYNRNDMLLDTLDIICKHTPVGAPIIVVDDGSQEPVVLDGSLSQRVSVFRFEENQGIAAAKNKSLELLEDAGVRYGFLFDSDTYPTAPSWWIPYVVSGEPHLMYQFETSPSHWPLKRLGANGLLRWFDKSRGCMLFVDLEKVLPVVGGMHTAFGKHGAEHGDWSERIHKAGLTRYKFADVMWPKIKCLDETDANISSVDYTQHQQWRTVDASKLPLFADWRQH